MRDDDTWRAAVRSHIGLVRAGNEDASAVAEQVWLVADGLGGHAGGEVASQAAVTTALRVLQAGLAGGESPQSVLAEAFAAAHQAVREGGKAGRGLRSMGTTLVGAIADGNGQVWVASLGDSRAYLLGDDGLTQLTRDDNYAADLVAAGAISEDEARVHPGQFMLTKAMIADDDLTYAPQIVPVLGSGRLLLCSDGLNAEVPDAAIEQLLGDGEVDAAADALIAAALESGGSDNITVICIDLP